MVNNFDLIYDKKLIFDSNLINKFILLENKDIIYHVQILQRKKDDPSVSCRNHIIKTYYIKNLEHLLARKNEIIQLCETFKARAYINLSPKSEHDIHKILLKKATDIILSNNAENPRLNSIMDSVVGVCKSAMPIWVIDIDDVSIKEDVKKTIKEISLKYPSKKNVYNNPIDIEIPTVHGIHLLAHPFNLKEFKEKFPNIDIHKNSNGTLLYAPDFEQKIYKCSECGGTDILIKSWIDPNTNIPASDIDEGKCWCEDCGKETSILMDLKK